MKKKFIVNAYPFSENTAEEASETKEIKAPAGWGCRHSMATLTFFGSTISYMLRSNLSMAIIGMVHHGDTNSPTEFSETPHSANTSAISNSISNETGSICPNLPIIGSYSIDASNNTEFVTENVLNGEFYWDTEQQGIILGSFFWGYVITHIPAGLLADKWGAKWVFGIGLLIASLFALLTPIAARYGIIPLIIVRIIQGLGEGVTPPATHVLVSHWSHPHERCKLGAFIYAGNQAGTMLGMVISGLIMHSNFLGGWPAVFYIEGLMGCIWFVFWSLFLFSKPSQHPSISDEERQYIEGALEGQTSNRSLATPWTKIFTSLPMWAILVAQTGNSWGLYTLVTELPTYMHRVLRLDIQSNCWLSAMPFFCMLISAIIVSRCGDFFRSRKILSTTSSRKLFNTIAHWGCALALVIATCFGCDRILAITFITIAIALNGIIGGGYQINHVDIAPNHSGVLMGLCNGVANIGGIAAPYAAGKILKDKGSLSDWQLVFFIASAVYFFDNLFYIIFASGEVQPWNDATESSTKGKTKSTKIQEISEHL